MSNTRISYELNDVQQKKFDDWKVHLREIFGDCGLLKWMIYSDGIGTSVEVVSSHAPNHPLDLTDVDSW
jgi:hypothetical protein